MIIYEQHCCTVRTDQLASYMAQLLARLDNGQDARRATILSPYIVTHAQTYITLHIIRTTQLYKLKQTPSDDSSYSVLCQSEKLCQLLSVFSILKMLNLFISNKKIHYHNLLDVNFLNLIFVFFQIKSKMEKQDIQKFNFCQFHSNLNTKLSVFFSTNQIAALFVAENA